MGQFFSALSDWFCPLILHVEVVVSGDNLLLLDWLRIVEAMVGQFIMMSFDVEVIVSGDDLFLFD